jgi:hypothetical protein
MKKLHRHNAGCGDLLCFHGAYREKKDAVRKEGTTPGAFVKMLPYSSGFRYAVLTRRKTTRNPADDAVKLSRAQLRKRNMAFDWMAAHDQDYSSAQMLAQAASTKYGFPVSGLIRAARQLIPQGRKNPLFTRGEKRKLRKKIKHAVKAAARRGLFRLFGIKKKTQARPAPHAHRGTGRSSAVRDDVISALINQGYSRKDAARMVPQAAAGEDFTSLFKRSMKRNPDLSPEQRAIKFFRGFNGADPTRVIRMENTIVESGDYAVLGKLFGYDMSAFPTHPFGEVLPNLQVKDDAGIMLCGANIKKDADGRLCAHQAVILGGNQNLEPFLESIFGITSKAQFLDLGELKNIWYVARKKQDNFKLMHYHHTFGEEEQTPAAKRAARPYLMYDRVHQKQFIVGGNYSIPFEGIRN